MARVEAIANTSRRFCDPLKATFDGVQRFVIRQERLPVDAGYMVCNSVRIVSDVA
jgi:hypothetical protein